MAPATPSFNAVALPIPEEAPVIITTRLLTASSSESASTSPAPGIRFPNARSVERDARVPLIATSVRLGAIGVATVAPEVHRWAWWGGGPHLVSGVRPAQPVSRDSCRDCACV